MGNYSVRRGLAAYLFLAAAMVCWAGPAAERAADPDGVIEIKAGTAWSHEKAFGPVRVRLVPQIAAWLESADGKFAGDLAITSKSARSAWGKVRRPEALPAWSHARGVRYGDGLFMPTRGEPLPDAVTTATPVPDASDGIARVPFVLPRGLPDGYYRILVEVNNSFDFNDAFPDGGPKGSVNGQPAVVYGAVVEIRDGRLAGGAAAEYVGFTSADGSDGRVRAGSDGLTSALSIVAGANVRGLR